MEAPYGEVTERYSKALIVATGPSARGVNTWDVPSDVCVIAVNGALRWLPHVDVFFSLDPSREVREYVRIVHPGVKYYMAVPDDYGTPKARVPSHRDAPEQHITYLRRIVGDGFKGAKETLSESTREIHTGNSAYGALGLAYLMGAKDIAIIGLDCTREEYAYGGGRPKCSFDHLPGLFASATSQLVNSDVKVVNGSLCSTVDCFDRVSPQEAVDWISRRDCKTQKTLYGG